MQQHSRKSAATDSKSEAPTGAVVGVGSDQTKAIDKNMEPANKTASSGQETNDHDNLLSNLQKPAFLPAKLPPLSIKNAAVGNSNAEQPNA